MNSIKQFLHARRLQLAKTLRLVFVGLLFFSVFMFFSNSLWVVLGDNKSASEASVGNTTIPHYNYGIELYRAEVYPASVEVLTKAYNALLEEDGGVAEHKRQLAGQIKFLTGNALVKSGKLQGAVEAYKEALRQDPTHMYAKYNLELLQQMNGGKGPGQPDQPGGDGSGKPPRKGI
jgi:tetratricopeptide (TPR) repeat protein